STRSASGSPAWWAGRRKAGPETCFTRRSGRCAEVQVWFYEDQSPDLRIGLRVRSVVHHEKSPYQEILVVDTDEWGRMLALDNIIQTNEVTEFVYHEM